MAHVVVPILRNMNYPGGALDSVVKECGLKVHVSHSLNSLKRVFTGDYLGGLL